MTPTEDPRTLASDEEMRQAVTADVGTGTPVSAGGEDPTVSLLRRYPVALLGLVLLLPTFAAAVTAWSQGQTVVAIITSAASALIATLTPIVHKAVTPIADPKLAPGLPLGVVATVDAQGLPFYGGHQAHDERA